MGTTRQRGRVFRGMMLVMVAVLVGTLGWPAWGNTFKGEVEVPVIFDATGPNSAGDLPLQKMTLGLTDWWNTHRGGIAGYKAVLKGIDFSYDMSKCMTIYNGLIAKGYPAVMVRASGPAVMVKPLANRNKIVTFMAPSADVCYLEKNQKESYLFSPLPIYADIYTTFVHYIVDVDWPKQGKDRKPVIGGFNQDATYGREVDLRVRKTCEELGLKYVSTWCKFGITEAASQVAILKREHCDYVLGMQVQNESMVIEKEVARMDYHPQMLLHSPFDPAIIKAGYAINVWGYNFAGGLETPGGKVATDLWKKYAPDQTFAIAQWAFAFCAPLYTAMDRTIQKKGIDNLTGENIKNELESFRNEDLFDGLTAPYTYTKRDHSGPQAIKYQKCIDKEGNMYWTDWISIPKKSPEELTVEHYKK